MSELTSGIVFSHGVSNNTNEVSPQQQIELKATLGQQQRKYNNNNNTNNKSSTANVKTSSLYYNNNGHTNNNNNNSDSNNKNFIDPLNNDPEAQKDYNDNDSLKDKQQLAIQAADIEVRANMKKERFRICRRKDRFRISQRTKEKILQIVFVVFILVIVYATMVRQGK